MKSPLQTTFADFAAFLARLSRATPEPGKPDRRESVR